MNFNKAINKLAKIPRIQRTLIYGVIYVLIALIYWAILYLPTSGSLDAARQDQVNLIAQLKQVDLRVQNKEAFKAELEELMRDFKHALEELPNDREIPVLLKSISTLGKKVGLEVQKFQPEPEVKRRFVAEVPVALQVEGTFHEVAMFFDRLSKMDRIVYIQNIEMGSPTQRGGNVYLTVEGNAVTFRFLDESERQEPEKGKARRRRSKAKGGR